MAIRIYLAALTILFFLASAPGSSALEKVKLGTAIRAQPAYYIPILTAEDKGFWKENGLDVEWVPFRAAVALHQAVAAGHIQVGLDSLAAQIQGKARGVPEIVISDLQKATLFGFYVLANSPIKAPNDLSGTKIGMASLGGTPHAYGRATAKSLGLEGKIKFVGAGGARENVAAIKAGALDVIGTRRTTLGDLWVKGEVREVLLVDDFLPKEWTEHVVFAHKDFPRKNPTIAKGIIRSLLQATEFAYKNPGWAIVRMRAETGFSEETEKAIFNSMIFSRDGKLSRSALENVTRFLVDYGIVAKEKAPAIEEIYTPEFLP